MGSEFWNPLIDWVKEYQLKNHYISMQDLDLFRITDEPEETAKIICDFHKGKHFTPNF